MLTWALPQHNRSDARAFVVAVLLALLLAPAAAAHVSVRPALLFSSREALLRIELPGLRPGQDPTRLEVSGPGIRQLSSERSGGLGEESRWRVLVRVETPPGPLPLLLRARYADGRSVQARQTLTVLPARDSGGSGISTLALGAGIVGLLAGASALLLVVRSRRRP